MTRQRLTFAATLAFATIIYAHLLYQLYSPLL